MGLMLKENRLKVNYYFNGQVKRLINKPEWVKKLGEV